jgi:putative FmdB family regulatory protein
MIYYTLVLYLGGGDMPVYEYRCEECDERFELFVRSMTEQSAFTCPECGSQRIRKNISLFGVGSTGGGVTSAASCGPGPV